MKSYKKEKNSFNKISNIIIFVLILILVWCGYTTYTSKYVTSFNANTEGRFISIESRVAGMVSQVYVEQNLEVKKGDLMLEIDSTFYRQELQRKESELNKLKTKLYFKEHKYEEKENPTIISDENKKMEEKEEVFPKSSYSSYSKMYDKDIIRLQNKYKKAKIDEDTENDEEETDKTTVDDILKDIKAIEIQISDLKLAISNSKVYAPQDGIITDINVKDGDFVEVSQQLLSITPKMVWIMAKFASDDAQDILIGQPVKIKITGFKNKKFKGVVSEIYDNSIEQAGSKAVIIVFSENYTDYNIEAGTFAECRVKIR